VLVRLWRIDRDPYALFFCSTISSDAITVDAAISLPSAGIPSLKLRQNVEWIERETIRRALEVSPAKRHAAQLMGISSRALSY
jgi:hypothetical protein